MAKALKELDFKDDFMFSATLLDSENCRLVLECILGMPIEHVDVMREKSIVYHSEYKGIRLDVYAKDENNTRYDVEMQVVSAEYLKRARYYHSSMDMDLLGTGVKYNELPKCFVIFICDNDPFGMKKYYYTRKSMLVEAPEYEYDDGEYSIFLSTKGENDNEVSKELVNFLKYVGDSNYITDDTLVNRLKDSVSKIKRDREMEGRYMLFEELQEQNYQRGILTGKFEDILSVLSLKGEIPNDAEAILKSIVNAENANQILMEAVKSESVDGFFDMLSSNNISM